LLVTGLWRHGSPSCMTGTQASVVIFTIFQGGCAAMAAQAVRVSVVAVEGVLAFMVSAPVEGSF
jgi:hypothetical protein